MPKQKFCDVYFRAYESLEEESDSGGFVELTKATKKLSVTPGLSFRPGTNWRDIIGHMTAWGWLEVEGDNRILLKREKLR